MQKITRRAKALLANKLVWALAAIVAIVVVAVLLLSGGDEEPTTVAPPTGGQVSARDLAVGVCVSDALSTQGDVTTFDAVDCAKPHDGEVYTIIELEGTAYPGDEFVLGKGQRGCRARLRRQATAEAFKDRQLGYKFVYPTKASWAQGDHEITCLATYRKPRTGKLEQRPQADQP